MNLAWIFSYCTFSEWSLSEKLEGVEVNHGSWNRHK